MKSKKENAQKSSADDCNCSPNCDCGSDCNCTPDNKCNDDCTCNHETDENCACEDDCTCGETRAGKESHEEICNNEEHKEYLNDLQRTLAEFDNYRKRMQTALSDARNDGFMEAIEKFLPALDSFKMATDMITDKNTLTGIKFIEKGILDTLSKIGVEEIDCSGEFDPNFHQAIDVDTSSDAPPNTITKVAYKGFTYNGKVIRYAQVIVRK